jgi:hypothetical protein
LAWADIDLHPAGQILRVTGDPTIQQVILKGELVATRTVPEPATWLLMGLGMIGLVTVARRKYGR